MRLSKVFELIPDRFLAALILVPFCLASSLLLADDEKKKPEKAHTPPPAQEHAAPRTAPAQPAHQQAAPAENRQQQRRVEPARQPETPRQPRYERQQPAQPSTPQPNTVRQPNATPAPDRRQQPDYRQQPNQPNTVRQPEYNRQPNATPNRPNAYDPSRGRSERSGAAAPVRTNPGTTFRGANNTQANFRRDGSVREVRARGMVIEHGPGGVRRIVAERPDHTIIVTNRAGNGYVQRPFAYGGQSFANRTYSIHGVSHTSYYRSYSYRGVMLQGYAPVRYYSPGFYGWAYAPWSTPAYYRWGWTRDPWYGYYGGYFSPYASYPSASLWLTDYVISSDLQQAYQDQMDAGAVSGRYSGQSALTPDVKQAIADEVQRQLAMENAERQATAQGAPLDPNYSGIPQMLNDNTRHTLVVGATLEVNGGQQDCAMTAGDVVQLTGASAQDGSSAEVKVLASKGQDCPVGTVASVSLQDLQEMQNNMRQTMDQGLNDLQTQQGQNGLPRLPAGATGGQIPAAFAAAAPPPDSNASSLLSQQAQEATQADQEVVSQAQQGSGNADTAAPPSNGAPAEPVTIALDQTVDQVIGILGPPSKIVDLGAKKIYVYSDMKITFQNGRVSDVQ